ncbi:MAG: MATE family efflux transporter [Clostridia bacterium]|nr:MATE family efflux transporter [Clostridia bacterium]
MQKAKQKFTLFSAKALALLIIPIVIEAALSMSLGLVDSFMVKDIGNLGNAVSAVSNVDQISNLLIQLFVAFGVGGAVITSQYLGANKTDDANKSAKQLVVIMLLFSFAVTAICLGLNHQIVNLFFGGNNGNGEYLEYAYTYFYFMAASFPFMALFNACAALLRAQRKSMNTMLSGAISFALNVGCNALFIYLFKWGIAGAAAATLIARIFPAVFLVILLSRKSNLVRIRIFEKFRFNGKMLKKIMRLAVPSGIENCLFQLGKLLTVSFITVGIYWVNGVNVDNTANTIGYNINTISCIFGNGVNTAILTVVGQAVGTGNIAQVKHYIKKMLAISYIGNAVNVGITMALSPLLISVFANNVTPETTRLAQNILWLCLSVQVVTYPLSFGMPAILKANSDVRYVMAAALASMIVMRVGLCYILTCDWAGVRLGAMGLWIGMVADWAVRSILFSGRYLSGRWKTSSGLLKPVEEYGESERVAEEELGKIFEKRAEK